VPLTLSANGQGQGEAGTLPGSAVDRDIPAHGPRKAARDVEPEPGTPRLRLIHPMELVENPVLVLQSDPLP
jgi:hypothetical protein